VYADLDYKVNTWLLPLLARISVLYVSPWPLHWYGEVKIVEGGSLPLLPIIFC